MAIGAGGIRSSSLAFGADQLGKRDKLQRAGILESYSGKLRLVANLLVTIVRNFFKTKDGFSDDSIVNSVRLRK
ncbi:hypothetical protein OIU79_030127 [Salix purpurea]|uniref:Uncharacterized protein n=1 Tax=Salix purpurea TaxID=77065 RepID=A0A9Q0ZWE5_SALPP|nr:hypothetical protein OIU79_030127 [Salix purpurea]